MTFIDTCINCEKKAKSSNMNWFKKISSTVLYHHTNTPPEIVTKEGLQQKSHGLTDAGSWAEEEGWIPKGCIYLSYSKGMWPGKYVYAVNVDGLELLPDFPSLVDIGAYIDSNNESLYWENDSEVPYSLSNKCEENSIYHKDITGTDSLNITGNACTPGPIDPSRIAFI